jgi:hypothetical protein
MNRLLPHILSPFFLACILYGQEAVSDVDALINEALNEQFGEDLLDDPELRELLGENLLKEVSEEPKWDHDLKVRTGLGHGDNVLYGAYEQVGSGYFFTSVDGLVFRLPEPGQANAYIYFYGENISYFEDVDPGRLFITQGQASHAWGETRQVGLMATHIFYDQVFDASADLDSFTSFGVSAHQVQVVPYLEAYLKNDLHFKAEALMGGAYYEDSYEDSRSGGGRLTFRKKLGELSYLEAVISHDSRRYREKNPRDADGYSVDGLLHFNINEASLRWLRSAVEPDGWSFSSKLSYVEQEDNASGYYDYSRVRVKQSASRSISDWEVTLSVGFTQYDYSVRNADFSGSDKLWRKGIESVVNLKRTLNDRAAFFLDGQFEHNRSNAAENIYDARRIVVGVEWGI